jgi:restriction system protein
MGNRRKSDGADVLVDLVAKLPWWAGVLLALLSYFLLHYFASQPAPAAVKPGQVGAAASQILWKTLATFGQYIVPFLCLFGAGLSAWQRRKRQDLIKEVTRNPAADALQGMRWREFEMLVGEWFRQQGYRVVETGGAGADGGVDLELTRGGNNGDEVFLVQCKQWRAYKVGVDVVRQLYGVMAARGAAGGFVVTSGRFTQEAVAFASGRNVKLLDGEVLHGLMRQVQSGAGRLPENASASAPGPQREPPLNQTAVNCPACGQSMVRRTAKRGANAGGQFWGCARYPECKGTRPI